MTRILKTILAPYFFLTSPASYAEAGEPEIDDPIMARLVRLAQIQLKESDLAIIDLSVDQYEYAIERLVKGPGPWAVLGVPLRPTDWKDRVLQPGAVWTTAKRREVHVNFMSNSHVKHTVAYLERCGAKHTHRYSVVKGELNRRVKEGLDPTPIQPYEPVTQIKDDELGDNEKTMGYRKHKFAKPDINQAADAARSHGLSHEDYIDSMGYWYDDESVEQHYF